MSKKNQTPILSDKIAELIAPKRLLDPEIDSEDETAARAIDYGLDEELDEPVSQLSDIRRKNVKLLDDVDAKYQGKVSSRRELEMDSSESVASEYDDDEAQSDSNEEHEADSVEKSVGEFSMLLTPRQKIKLAQNCGKGSEENSIESDELSEDENDIKSFAMKLSQQNVETTEANISDENSEMDANGGQSLEKWDDDYEGEEEQSGEELPNGSDDENESNEEEEEEEYNSDEEESDFDGGDMMPQTSTDKTEKQDLSRILPKQRTDDQVNKGVCVQNQLQIWEKLLEIRIHSQKMLIKANSLPQPTKFQSLAQNNEEFSQLANSTFDKVATLVTQMSNLQSLLLDQFTETKGIAKKRKRISLDDTIDSETKRNRLNDQLASDYASFKDYQYSVISKWHDRTKVLTPGSIKTQKQQGNIDVLRKIEAVLANREELIKKSQLLKGGYELFDKSTGVTEPKEPNANEENGLNAANGDAENHSDESVYSKEIYDDTDFYHSQLRELIEYKTSSSNNVNEVAKQFVELQKLRKKMKKAVDTRASKGRKIRYVVHNKLVSFMAPNDPGKWTDEQRDELFKSLFGAQS